MSDSRDFWSNRLLFLYVGLVSGGLVWLGRQWPNYFTTSGTGDMGINAILGGGSAPSPVLVAWLELVKLICSGLVGVVVTMVHSRFHGDRPPARSLMQAAVLLSVSGALMMIIIGNSTARALGIAGGASIIRFRTPVEDPKDTILLFLLLALGMALGLGAFEVCGYACLFLCSFLALLDRFGDAKLRTLMLDLVATSPEFPLEHVQTVLRAEVAAFEPMRMAQGSEAAMRYTVKVEPSASLAWISNRLMAGGTGGLKTVNWEPAKKSAE